MLESYTSAHFFFVLFSQLLVGWLAVAQWVKVEPATYTLSLLEFLNYFFLFQDLCVVCKEEAKGSIA